MRQYLTLIISVLILNSCVQETQKVETILLDCLTNQFNNSNVDIIKQLENFEAYLISNGSLRSSSGEAYYDFYSSVATLNDVPAFTDPEDFDKIFVIHPNDYYSVECLNQLSKMDTNELKSSKYYKLALAIQEANSEPKVTPAIVAKKIISVLNADDFTTPYYKTIALLTIAHTGSSDPGILIKSKPETNQPKIYIGYEQVSIILTPSDKVIINEKTIELNSLKSIIKEFLRKNESKNLINIITESGTTYDFYSQTQDILVDAYKEVKNTKSKELFNLPYDSLSNNEKTKVRNIYPMNIKENE